LRLRLSLLTARRSLFLLSGEHGKPKAYRTAWRRRRLNLNEADVSRPYRMIFRVRVGRPGRNDVTDPAERPARSDPEAWGDNEPENSGENSAVVELAYSGNDKTKNAGEHWIAHD